MTPAAWKHAVGEASADDPPRGGFFRSRHRAHRVAGSRELEEGVCAMENVWLASALLLGLALAASVISIRVAMSVALIEIMVGAIAGNLIGLVITDCVNFLAGFGAILLTFLAGTEIDSTVVRKHLGPSVGIG